MSSPNQNKPTSTTGNFIWQNKRVRTVVLCAAVLLIVFLLGLIPMWITARTRARDRDTAQASLRIGSLQNTLGDAAIDARRGEYESARQAASDLQAEIDSDVSVLNVAQRTALRSL